MKKFKAFTNEELSPETYASAAEKLRKKGHSKRADKLSKYASSKIEPAIVKFSDDDVHVVLPENIKIYEMDWGISLWVVIFRDMFDEVLGDVEDNWDESGVAIDITKETGKFEVSGIMIHDRKSARNLTKLIKQWASIQDNQFIKDTMKKLTINDIWMED